MARIKYSALVSDMRNSLNGSTLSKNRAGNYIRNKVTPVNPRTAHQQANRALFGALSSQWKSLSPAQRASWAAATKNFPYTDIFGDQKELDGKSLFIKFNANLQNAGQPIIQSAPVGVGIPEYAVTSAEAVYDAGVPEGVLQLTFSESAIPAGFTALVYATPPTPAQIGFVKNRYRLIGAVTPASASVNVSSLYKARFKDLTAGDLDKVVHFRVAIVSNTTGQMGVPSGTEATIEAN